jgi:calcineurin-like phosphoesterase family protein
LEFFTSDEHYNHINKKGSGVIDYCCRPFTSIEEMNEELIKRNNEVVKKKDLVYHIGDFAFGDPIPILKRLTGNHIFLQGSHDRFVGEDLPKYISFIYDVLEIRINRQVIFLNHYSQRRWPKSHYGSWHLFGHSHGGLESFGYSFDVGVDSHDFRPWSFDEVKDRMSKITVTEYPIWKDRQERPRGKGCVNSEGNLKE